MCDELRDDSLYPALSSRSSRYRSTGAVVSPVRCTALCEPAGMSLPGYAPAKIRAAPVLARRAAARAAPPVICVLCWHVSHDV